MASFSRSAPIGAARADPAVTTTETARYATRSAGVLQSRSYLWERRLTFSGNHCPVSLVLITIRPSLAFAQ